MAHAARALASAQVLRWSAHAVQAAQHLAWTAALAERAREPASARPRPSVLLALGTDLGLCGRLNQVVADRTLTEIQTSRPTVIVAVGVRLADLLGEFPALITEPAPSSQEAAAQLAQRVETQARALSRDSCARLLVVGALETTSDGMPRVTVSGAAPESPELTAVRQTLTPNPARLGEPTLTASEATSLLVHARTAHAVCLAAKTEASVRLASMVRAHESADQRIGEQERALRKARQERITQEMLEVLSGREQSP